LNELIHPDWPAPPNVRAVMTTRNTDPGGLSALLPAEPAWLRQVHGTRVVRLEQGGSNPEADAAVTGAKNRVCAIRAADCMPVLLVDEGATVVGAAHAGWRGLASGVLENTVAAMAVPGKDVIAWLGPAIGPKVYEVGDEVRAVFKEKDAFSPTRAGHWLLDLYAVARQRLRSCGVERIFGGGYCTYSEPERFYSYRRDGTGGRMAALIWLSEVESRAP
jgi:purine-nucleoside/S-methyl-5'-thioadenosine phosphorylase / adenosine deaminase